MRIAILDPCSGIAGDMLLGALVDVGLPREFLLGLPAQLGLEGVEVRIGATSRAQIACHKVDFVVPPQPHGRHLKQIVEIVERSAAPTVVKQRAVEVFTLITECEARIHGTTVEAVHLHEVGSVDAILDIVGVVWGISLLGIERIYCGTLPLGDGFVDTAHGRMAVPTAATLRLLEGLPVRSGPDGSGELVTPTGAALVRVLSSGLPPDRFVPQASGYGAGTKEFSDRANVVRVILAEMSAGADGTAGDEETLTVLAADIDDISGEQLAVVADWLRDAGALDVALIALLMKKGRPGHRVEVLCSAADESRLRDLLLRESTTIGVRRHTVSRHALPRTVSEITVRGQPIGLKTVTLPDGGTRTKPEFDDVRRAAEATDRPLAEILDAIRRTVG